MEPEGKNDIKYIHTTNNITKIKKEMHFMDSVTHPMVRQSARGSKRRASRVAATLRRMIATLAMLMMVAPVASWAAETSAEPTEERIPDGKGRISGSILDEAGASIPGAVVKVIAGAETGKGASSNLDGHYYLDLKPGTYAIEVAYVGFATKKVTDIKVSRNKATTLDIILSESSELLDEVVVTASYNEANAAGLYLRQKSLATMSDGVSADLIKKTSDNNIAQVLKRVSGVTIDKGKYVTVRGMSERYNNVQLNGASLPSTEPNRRNFSFDIIPSGLVDNVTIAKTFTPDMDGEFTGGLVQVNTLAVPHERLLKISAGTGFDTMSTGKDFYTNKRFGSDYFFGDIKNRQWYAGDSDEEVKQSLLNAAQKNTFPMYVTTGAPTQNYSIVAGTPFSLGGSKLGAVVALTYRHEEKSQETVEGIFQTREWIVHKPTRKSNFMTAVGVVANLGWEAAGHKITWRNLFNNRFTHDSFVGFHADYSNFDTVYDQYTSPLRNMLWQTQIDGVHNFLDNHLKLTWDAAHSRLRRTSPDSRMQSGAVIGEKDDGSDAIRLSLAHSSNEWDLTSNFVEHMQLTENKTNVGVNLEYATQIAGNRQAVKLGYRGAFRTADYQQQYLQAVGKDPFEPDGMTTSQLYDPKNFEEGIIYYRTSGIQKFISFNTNVNFYKGDQSIHAAYLMGEFSFFDHLRLITGVRMEQSTTYVKTIPHLDLSTEELNVTTDDPITEKHLNWLPAATLIYSITPEVNFRVAYAKTLARPDFNEIAYPTRYYNPYRRITMDQVRPIKMSTIDNWDARIEWYPKAGEVISASYFHKKLLLPVEIMSFMIGDGIYYFPVNLEEATINGVELNWRKSLGFIAPSADFLRDFYFTGNLSLIKGKLEHDLELIREIVGGKSDEDDRANALFPNHDRVPQGLSPYTLNMGLAYEGKYWGAALSYNRNGQTLVLGQATAEEDIYENSRDILDCQVSAKFLNGRLELKVNASDLLNQPIITYANTGYVAEAPEWKPKYIATEESKRDQGYNEGDWILGKVNKGRSFSFSLSWKL